MPSCQNMLVPAVSYFSRTASIRTSAHLMLPRNAGGRNLVSPGGLIDALPGQGLKKHTLHCHSETDIDDFNTNTNGPVVVGGAVLDCVIHIEDDNLKLDGRTVPAAAGARAAGGVARNVAAALALLGSAPRLVTALGDDAAGRLLLASLPRAVDTRGVLLQRGGRTPVYAALLGAHGAVRLGLADMRLHARGLAASRLLPVLSPLLGDETEAPLLVADGNAPSDTLLALLRLCHDRRVPVWFEPTDVHKAAKPFETDMWKNIAFASPNLNELRIMASAAGYPSAVDASESPEVEAWRLSQHLLRLAPRLALFVTLGARGVLVARGTGSAHDALFPSAQDSSIPKVYQARHYAALPPPSDAPLCESGAGDCFAAGVIAAALRGCTEAQAMAAGLEAARASLVCPHAVPEAFVDVRFDSEAPFRDVL